VTELPPGFRAAVLFVALANLAFFGIEFAVAFAIGSVALVADSIDFLEDASLNALILLALAWSPKARARLGMALARLLLAPSLAALWTAWTKLATLAPPLPFALSLTGLAALVVNLLCAFVLAPYRRGRSSLAKAAFLSARNDALANLAIIAAGLVTLAWRSAWPDLVVGLGIVALNADAARKVWTAARQERATAAAP
jgi:Co/Zn/Cd efflux system component